MRKPIATSDHTSIPFRDMIMLALVGFASMAVMLLTLIGDKVKQETAGISPPGSVMVELVWPQDSRADVDLWVQAPGDVPVGYSNKGGVVFNLLRDDLGQQLDVSGLNYENSFSRGLPAGEYTVNLHLYRSGSDPLPIKCKVIVTVKGPDQLIKKSLLADVSLEHEGVEKTALRFKLDDDGDVVSTSRVFKPLRSGAK